MTIRFKSQGALLIILVILPSLFENLYMPLLSLTTCLLIFTLSAAHYDSKNSNDSPAIFGQPSSSIKNQDNQNFRRGNSESAMPECSLLNNYTQIIRYLTLYGDWTSETQIKTFTKTDGFVAFLNKMNPATNYATDAWNFTLHLYDGEYVDQKEIRMTFIITEPSKNLIANYSEATFMARDWDVEFDYFKTFGGHIESCKSDFTLHFIDTSTGKPLLNPSKLSILDVGLQLNCTSPSCGMKLSTSILNGTYPASWMQVLLYASAVIFYCVFGYVVMNKVITRIELSPSKAPHISHWSLMFVSIWNVYLVIFHLLFAAEFGIWFVVTSFFLLFLRIFREMYLTYILFARETERNGSTVAEIKSCCKFFGVYYLLIGVVLFIILSFPTAWRNLISSFFLVPQIILTVYRNKKYRFSYWYEFGMAFCQCLWIAYANLLKDNILRSSPKALVVMTYIFLCLLQIGILGIQTKYPRFFWSPKIYRYTFTPALNESYDICPICIEPLIKDKEELKQSLVSQGSSKTKLFQTPCHHRFHDKCLKKWMKKKFECPFCKRKIPSISLEVSGVSP